MKHFLSLFLLFANPNPLQALVDWPPLSELKARADQGDLQAKVARAFRCFFDQGDTRDPEVVHAAFLEGMQAGLPDAYAGLALCHLRGFGAPEDAEEAYRLASLSTRLGSAKGYLALGQLAMAARPVLAMQSRTQEYLKKAAELGDLQAKFILATYQFQERGFSRRIVDPKSLEQLAELGHEDAIFSLFQYYKGKDEKKSTRYLKQALDLGVPSALASQAFEDPRTQDFDTINTPAENRAALDRYRLAAARGGSEEIFQYGYGLSLHPGLAEDGENWREIMSEAACLGHITACDILAWSYYQPKEAGVDPDYAIAEELLLKTLEFPKLGRYHTLGLIYLNGGHGVEKNPERAFKLLGKYADEIPYVYRILGKTLTDWEPLQGKDTYKIRAYACYLRYQKMVPEPKEGLFEERTKALALTAEQIAEAQKLADEGYPTKPEHTLWASEDGPYAPDNLARDAVAAYREKGKAGMTTLLDERFTELHLARPRHPMLFRENTPRFLRLFKEAQTESGRDDPALAADLFEWLFNNASRYPVSFSKFDIVNNYTITLSQSGQRAKAKIILNQMAEILALSGFDTDLKAHPNDRPFQDFPLVNSPNYLGVEYFGLDHAAFLTQLSSQALVEGRWKDALAQAHAHSEVVLHKLESDPSIKTKVAEWHNQMVASRAAQARVFDLLQFHDRADKLHDLNSDDDYSKAYAGRSQHTAKVSLARNQIRRGEVDEKLVNQLNELVKLISRHQQLVRQDRFEAQHVLMQALFKLGQNEEAWTLLEKLREESPRESMFASLWVEQKLLAGQLDGLEDLLISQLRWVREQGENVAGLRLHLLYVKFLKASGRLDEAIQVQNEALRLMKSFDLYTWLPEAYLELADLYALAGNLNEARSQRDRAGQILSERRAFPDDLVARVRERLSRELPGSAGEEEVPVWADLQPRVQVCVPLEGFAARGLFLLKNPSRSPLSGQLQIRGNHQGVTELSDENFFEVTVDPAQLTPKTSPLDLTLQAGEMIIFDFSTVGENFGKGGRLKLNWLPEKGPPMESEWSYEPADENGVLRTVVDAGLYTYNPFYSVPIYHLVQSRTPLTKPVDLKVVASQEARIEVYDEGNELVFVDQNGDGDLLDRGDVLVSDANWDGHGDLNVTRENARSTVFYLQVTPRGELSKEGLSLHLQSRGQTGKWEDVSRDLILATEK